MVLTRTHWLCGADPIRIQRLCTGLVIINFARSHWFYNVEFLSESWDSSIQLLLDSSMQFLLDFNAVLARLFNAVLGRGHRFCNVGSRLSDSRDSVTQSLQ